MQQLELERVPWLVQEQVRKLERVRERERERKSEKEQEQKKAQLLAQVLSQVPLVLGWRLAQGWELKNANVQEKLRELFQEADTVFLPGELDILTKTVPDRQVDCRSHFYLV